METTKKNEENRFSLTNINAGLNHFNPSRNMVEIKMVVIEARVKTVFIFSLLLFEVGRNLIKPVFKPNKLNVVIKLMTEIKVEPKPIS